MSAPMENQEAPVLPYKFTEFPPFVDENEPAPVFIKEAYINEVRMAPQFRKLTFLGTVSGTLKQLKTK